MNEQPLKKDIFDLLRILSSGEDLTQRGLSTRLGISLGKTNYLLKSLARIGLLEIRNFAVRDHKIQKFRYFITKKGFDEKIDLTYYFLKEKENEYKIIKKEWEDIRKSNVTIKNPANGKTENIKV